MNVIMRIIPYVVSIHKTVLREKTVECMAISLFNSSPREFKKIACEVHFVPEIFRSFTETTVLECTKH